MQKSLINDSWVHSLVILSYMSSKVWDVSYSTLIPPSFAFVKKKKKISCACEVLILCWLVPIHWRRTEKKKRKEENNYFVALCMAAVCNALRGLRCLVHLVTVAHQMVVICEVYRYTNHLWYIVVIY